MSEEFVQVNVNITAEDAASLDQLMLEDGYSNRARSAFIRRLIRSEFARRKHADKVIVTEAAVTA